MYFCNDFFIIESKSPCLQPIKLNAIVIHLAKQMPSNNSIENAIQQIIDELSDEHTNMLDFINSQIEAIVIKKVLIKTDFNQTKASKILGISRSTLRYKIKNLNLVD